MIAFARLRIRHFYSRLCVMILIRAFFFSLYFSESFVVDMWCKYCICSCLYFYYLYFIIFECLYVHSVLVTFDLCLVLEFVLLHWNLHPFAIQFAPFALLFISVVFNHRFQLIYNNLPKSSSKLFRKASQKRDPTSSYFQNHIKTNPFDFSFQTVSTILIYKPSTFKSFFKP